jgi:hypothetical protein
MALEDFTQAYIAAMLWSTNDESNESGGYPLDKNYDADDLAPEARTLIDEDCKAFYEAHSHLFTSENCFRNGCPVDVYAGHDFWLTRAGHGCGFWDGDWRPGPDETLTEASYQAGERDVEVGDDKRIYYR